MISEFSLPETRERVLVNGKAHATVVMVDGRDVSVFDRGGRLRYAARSGVLLRRGLDGRCLRFDRPPVALDDETARAELEGIYRTVGRVARDAPPEARGPLAEVLRCDGSVLEKDARRFREIYGTVPILPPDQYGAVYLQATVGCRTNLCTFCSLYRDRSFQVRSLAEFRDHIQEATDFLGRDIERRRSVFLGDANAMAVPMNLLRSMVEEVRSALPDRDIHAFSDAALHRVARSDDLRELRLARITFGLETAHLPLLRRLRKPGSLAGLLLSVERVKSAGSSVGLTVLVGVGGREFAERHVADTVEVLQRAALGAGDFVYLSPLRGELTEEELRGQTEEFRRRLGDMRMMSGVKVVPYDISRFVY